jgi:phosphoribosylaminoimidazolecarboxamide formyltransferase / IMP cyclohydrolase
MQGKALSFNNVADTDAALECVKVFDEPACVIVKHANPCGVADRRRCSRPTDGRSPPTRPRPSAASSPSIGAWTRPPSKPSRAAVRRGGDRARGGPTTPPRGGAQEERAPAGLRPLDAGAGGREYKRVGGGLLVQTADDLCLDEREALRVVTRRRPGERRWPTCCSPGRWPGSSSRTPSSMPATATVGVGAGQMSRVVSARIAGLKAEEAGLEVAGAVMASDAFFPFRDGIDAAAEAGIAAVIQPGGSMRDEEVIAAADEHGMAMVFTGMRHFRH